VKRRSFITLLGGAAAWPLAARAQQPHQIRRIGTLLVSADGDSDTTARLAGFRQGLERLGWAEGRDIRIDYRFAAGRTDRFQSLAKELVALQPEVILAHSTPIAAALQRESSAIPIVFVNVSDPIGSGFISSLARPGGNLTGLLRGDHCQCRGLVHDRQRSPPSPPARKSLKPSILVLSQTLRRGHRALGPARPCGRATVRLRAGRSVATGASSQAAAKTMVAAALR
jgi:hypothetical protein